jgi:hypothetical protein
MATGVGVIRRASQQRRGVLSNDFEPPQFLVAFFFVPSGRPKTPKREWQECNNVAPRRGGLRPMWRGRRG